MERKVVNARNEVQELKVLIIVCSIALTFLVGVAVSRYLSLPDYEVVRADEYITATERR